MTKGEQDRLSIGAQTEGDVKKIGAQGDQDRKTLDKTDNLDAKKENRATARSRTMARAF